MTGKWFDTIVVIILENTGWSSIQSCKFLDWFRKNGCVLTNWTGVTHPSGPNYRAMFSGNTWSGNEFDGVKRPNIGDAVAVCVQSFHGDPAQRHNPFLDMNSLLLEAHQTPSILYLGMDDQNNAHSGPLSTADDNAMEALALWQNGTYGPRDKTLFLLTFDEAFGDEYSSNHVFCGVAGCGIAPGSWSSTVANHLAISKMLYANWGVPPHGSELPCPVTVPIWE